MKLLLLACLVLASSCWAEEMEDLQKACDEQDNVACSVLGIQYLQRRSNAEDLQKALQYLKKGCELKNGGACIYLADFSLRGMLMPRSVKEGVNYLEKGCEYKNGIACGM